MVERVALNAGPRINQDESETYGRALSVPEPVR
jgi:hypothetical protein